MPDDKDTYPGRRVSYDGALCTVRYRTNYIPGTQGEWLGVEWDDPTRGKHNGFLKGVQYFACLSSHPTVASFVRPTRRFDPERTVLDAIKFKYAAQAIVADTVIISGKVAEEVGFDKVMKEQAALSNLKIVILDQLVVYGIAPRGSSREVIKQAQEELADACPNISELDLGYNPIEDWAAIEDICAALPKLKVLKLNSIRLRDLGTPTQQTETDCFKGVRELHLNECLLGSFDILDVLHRLSGTRFPSLKTLWLSRNEMADFQLPSESDGSIFDTVETLMLENNRFRSLDPLINILRLFPQASHISLQSNKIAAFGKSMASPERSYAIISNMNLSANEIQSFEFVDQLSQTFPSLKAVRVSQNPFYDQSQSSTASIQSTEKSYYLTLARMPELRSLNYTEITARDRDEGEIYYLSVAEKDIRNTITNATTTDTVVPLLLKRYPHYASLCEKHDRDNLITQLTSNSTSNKPGNKDAQDTQPKYPAGSVASRLVTCTFYIPQPQPHSQAPPISTTATRSFTRPIPKTIQTTSIFALISRELHLPQLSFKLTYESDELDTIYNDSSTRSQIYADRNEAKSRWEQWGDWDADALVEKSIEQRKQGESGEVDEGHWTDDGLLIKDGKRWKRREVEVLFGTKSWGDWFEDGVTVCKIRVEPFERKK